MSEWSQNFGMTKYLIPDLPPDFEQNVNLGIELMIEDDEDEDDELYE